MENFIRTSMSTLDDIFTIWTVSNFSSHSFIKENSDKDKRFWLDLTLCKDYNYFQNLFSLKHLRLCYLENETIFATIQLTSSPRS